MTDEVYLKVPEVAAKLRVSNMTVYRLVETSELTSVRVGRSLRIPASGLKRFIDSGGNDPDVINGWKNLSERPGETRTRY